MRELYSVPGQFLVEADQLFFGAEEDLDPSPAPLASDPDPRLEAPCELLLGVAGERVALARVDDPVAGRQGSHALFRLSHREGPAHDLLGKLLLVIRRGESNQGLRMSGRKRAFADLISHLCW